jgi:hypothetical protein
MNPKENDSHYLESIAQQIRMGCKLKLVDTKRIVPHIKHNEIISELKEAQIACNFIEHLPIVLIVSRNHK